MRQSGRATRHSCAKHDIADAGVTTQQQAPSPCISVFNVNSCRRASDDKAVPISGSILISCSS